MRRLTMPTALRPTRTCQIRPKTKLPTVLEARMLAWQAQAEKHIMSCMETKVPELVQSTMSGLLQEV